MSGGDDEVLGALADIARAKLGWEGRLARETPLVEALALDSLRRLTLVVAVEDRFRVSFDDEDETAMETVGDLVDAIGRKRAGREPHAG